MTTRLYRYLPRECQTGTCDHEPGRCTRYRSRQCLSGECTHGQQNLFCGINYDEALAQPAAPTASPVDFAQPHVVRVVLRRPGGAGDWTAHTSYRDHDENGRTQGVSVAQEQAARTRVEHSFYGPMTVHIWQRGDDEHYRNPTPAHAERYDFPAQPMLDPKRQQLGTLD